MLKGQPPLRLPHNPFKHKSLIKFVLGAICLSFFLDYQPTLSFPPLKQNLVLAQENTQTVTINAQASTVTFQLPHPGYLSTPFSYYHPGVDIATGLGMPIKPIAKGTVVDTGFNFWGLGLIVIVQHDGGYQSLYAHMGKIYVTKNQQVSITDTLGEVGLTGHTSGPHTHLEISKDNQKINPLTLLPEIRQNPTEDDFKTITATNSLQNPSPKPQISNFNSLSFAQPEPKPVTPKIDFKQQIKNSL